MATSDTDVEEREKGAVRRRLRNAQAERRAQVRADGAERTGVRAARRSIYTQRPRARGLGPPSDAARLCLASAGGGAVRQGSPG